MKKNVKRFPNRTASGDYNPRPVIVPPGTAAHLEGESAIRTERPSLPIAAAHTAHSPSRTRTHSSHSTPSLSSHSTRSPPPLSLSFFGSSVLPFLLYYYFTSLLYYTLLLYYYYFTTTTLLLLYLTILPYDSRDDQGENGPVTDGQPQQQGAS